eukprot:UN09991
MLLKCARCCLNVLQCIFDRVNKNGFIVCAINGLPFCASSLMGLRLIFSNILRVAALTIISEIFRNYREIMYNCRQYGYMCYGTCLLV